MNGRIITSAGIELVLIPGGSFRLGSPVDEPKRRANEGPTALISVKPFYLGIHPVTQWQYRAVMQTDPSFFRGDDLPVERVSWLDAWAFCILHSSRPVEPSSGYRLPTEIEWEYACRAGTTTPFHFGLELTAREANIDGRFPLVSALPTHTLERTTPVGTYPANAFGLYDMHGNVWEWCADHYSSRRDQLIACHDDNVYCGHARVLKGGAWSSYARFCRAAYRGAGAPSIRYYDHGFRIACSSESVR